MKLSLGGSTPICVTYHRTPSAPRLKRTRRFVGLRQLALNVVNAIVDAIDDLAFETSEQLEMPDGAVAVHWAVEIDDPWGPDGESQLLAIRVPERPVASTNFEVFRVTAPVDRVNGHEQALRDQVSDVMRQRGLYDPEAGFESL
jgi:hypothetical protein